MPYFDPGYFKKKPIKSRKVVKRTIKNKFYAWQLSKNIMMAIETMAMVVLIMTEDG